MELCSQKRSTRFGAHFEPLPLKVFLMSEFEAIRGSYPIFEQHEFGILHRGKTGITEGSLKGIDGYAGHERIPWFQRTDTAS